MLIDGGIDMCLLFCNVVSSCDKTKTESIQNQIESIRNQIESIRNPKIWPETK